MRSMRWFVKYTLFAICVVPVILLIIAVIIYALISLPEESAASSFMRRLNDEIERGATSIYLHELTAFDWDRVCLKYGYDTDYNEDPKRWELTFFRHKKEVETLNVSTWKQQPYQLTADAGCSSRKSVRFVINNQTIALINKDKQDDQ